MIRITTENAAAIEAALKNANGKAFDHTFTSFEDIETVAHKAEKRLEALGLPIKSRAGAKWVETSGEAVNGSYKYARKATTVHLVRRTAGWYLDSAEPATIYKDGGKAQKIQVTKKQEAEIIERIRAQIDVLKDNK